jgi:hypothetical protein
VLNARASYTVVEHIKVSVSAENLTDQQYIGATSWGLPFGAPARGRTFYAAQADESATSIDHAAGDELALNDPARPWSDKSIDSFCRTTTIRRSPRSSDVSSRATERVWVSRTIA